MLYRVLQVVTMAERNWVKGTQNLHCFLQWHANLHLCQNKKFSQHNHTQVLYISLGAIGGIQDV